MSDPLADLLKPSGAELHKEFVEAVAVALVQRGLTPDAIGSIDKLRFANGTYEAMHKDDDGNAVVTTLRRSGVNLVFTPSWDTGPAWPVVQAGKPCIVKHVKQPAAKASGWLTAVILPDIQVGYWRAADGAMEPTHDEAALSVALQILGDLNPDLVVLVGDNLDLPELSKYRLTPAYALTTQATMDRGALLAAQLRAAAPRAEIRWLAGNHEERLPNYILDNARAAFGLRRGMSPESWPVLSVPHLLHLDEHGITFLPGYPANATWINERLKVIHGDLVASGGSTAHKYLGREKTSVIYGHVHRREWAERTREDHDGPKTVLAASPGCLARTTGGVPSTKGGTDLDGRPLQRTEDWQTGLAVVRYEPGDGRFAYEQVAIHDGWAMFRGKDYTA